MSNHHSSRDLLRQLVLAKALFLRGCEFARLNDLISRMLAIHVFDNAVEMVLVTSILHQRKNVISARASVPELLRTVHPTLEKQLLDLHERRNGVHHAGDMPTQEDVIKYMGYAKDFLRTECQQISGIIFDDLSLADLIDSEDFKGRIKKVEEALRVEAYRNAIAECDTVLTDLFTKASDVFGAAGQLTGHFAGGEEFGRIIDKQYAEQFKDRDCYQFAKDASKAFLQLGQAATTMQFLDNLRSEFLAFRRCADEIDVIPESELKDDARRSLDFVMKVILKWQAEHLM
jgi:hypothetical protein